MGTNDKDNKAGNFGHNNKAGNQQENAGKDKYPNSTEPKWDPKAPAVKTDHMKQGTDDREQQQKSDRGQEHQSDRGQQHQSDRGQQHQSDRGSSASTQGQNDKTKATPSKPETNARPSKSTDNSSSGQGYNPRT